MLFDMRAVCRNTQGYQTSTALENENSSVSLQFWGCVRSAELLLVEDFIQKFYLCLKLENFIKGLKIIEGSLIADLWLLPWQPLKSRLVKDFKGFKTIHVQIRILRVKHCIFLKTRMGSYSSVNSKRYSNCAHLRSY